MQKFIRLEPFTRDIEITANFKNDFLKPLAGFTPGGDLCDDLVQRKILKHYDIQSMDEVHPTYLNGFISGASIYKELSMERFWILITKK